MSIVGRSVCVQLQIGGQAVPTRSITTVTVGYLPPTGTASSEAVTVARDPLQLPTSASAADRMSVHAGVGIFPTYLTPAGVRVAVRGQTLELAFDLPAAFPRLSAQARRWLGVYVRRDLVGVPYSFIDSAKAGWTQDKLLAMQQARERRKAEAQLASGLVRFRAGVAPCHGHFVVVIDPRGDADLRTDIRTAAVAITGRQVCFRISFVHLPFAAARSQPAFELYLNVLHPLRVYNTNDRRFESSATEAGGLKLDTNDYGDGSTYSESGNGPRPLHAPLFLHGDTISGSFELNPAAPAANTLAWQTGVAVGGADESDYVPNPVVASRDSMAPAIRQRDGSMIRFK